MSWDLNQIAEQAGKRVLITGANSGIGLEAAKVMLSKGAEVIMACRNLEKSQQVLTQLQQQYPQAEVSLMQLDLSSLESVQQFADAFKAKYDSLDILINNAGVMAPPYGETQDGFEMQFGTNHLGHFALAGHLLPLLENAEKGRIVVVSSVVHWTGKIKFDNLNSEKRYSRWKAYSQSKLANLMFAKELQRRLEKSNSKVIAIAVHPGYSSTNLQQYVVGGSLMNKIAQTQQDGAMPSLYAATTESLKGGEYIGPDGWLELRGKPKKAYVARQAKDEKVASRLWDVSESLTGVSYLS